MGRGTSNQGTAWTLFAGGPWNGPERMSQATSFPTFSRRMQHPRTQSKFQGSCAAETRTAMLMAPPSFAFHKLRE
jgi:hypothetical protein